MLPASARIRAGFRGLSPLNRRRVLVAAVLGLFLVAACVILNNAAQPWDGRAPQYLEDFENGRRKRLPTDYFAQVYLWKAGALNAGLLAAMLVTSPLWVGWLSGDGGTGKPGKIQSMRPTRWAWCSFGFAMVAGLALRLPMMERPLLFDEQDNLRRSIHGYVDVTVEGEKWVGLGWRDTFFENRQANNPALYGAVARASMDFWRALSGGAPDSFNLWMMRLPSLLSGVLLMGVIWRFLYSIGFPVAAAVAVFLVALHPMAIDYHSQARGYGFVMLFATLAAIFAYRGIRVPGWRPWIGYGLSQVAMLWSYQGAVYFALAMNGLLGAYFLVGLIRRGDRAPFVRFGLVTICSAMLFLQVMLPVVVQAKDFLENKFARSELNAEWAFTIVSAYGSGHALPEVDWWHAGDPSERDIGAYVTERFLPEHPLGAVLAFVVFPLLTACGGVFLSRENPRALLVIGAGLLAPLLAFLHQRLFAGLWLHHWYLIYMLPFLCILTAIGLAALAGRRRAVAIGGAPAFILFFGLAVETPLPVWPGVGYRANPEVIEIGRPGYLYRITKGGRMTREVAGGEDANGF